jgi:hypothetical protein
LILQEKCLLNNKLYVQRLTLTADHPEWEDYGKIIKIIGPEGTTDDETDGEEDDPQRPHHKRKVFRRIAKPWRSVYFDNLFEALDSQRRDTDALGQPIHGNKPRHRLRDPQDLDRKIAPVGLPINFYSDEWIRCQPFSVRQRILRQAAPSMTLLPPPVT